MKRFLGTALLLLAVLVGLYWAVFYRGFYLPTGGNTSPDLPFRTEATELRYWDGQDYAPLILRGVDVSASLPGHYATAYDAAEADYLRWFQAIGEMGANAVRATSIMNDDFYNAFYIYNTHHDQPLYLLQGTSVSDAVGGGSKDAYTSGFLDSLLEDGRALVDIVHGRKDLPAAGIRSGGVYRRDISPWVVGFLVGTEWYSDTISYTDHSAIRSGVYQGTYFQTSENATPFEAAMARVMDGIAAYETDKYGAQRPIGFLCDPSCDFLEYEEVYARQLEKHAQIDPEHIVPLPAMEAGRFAAYRLYDFCGSFSEYLSAAQKRELAPLLAGLPTGEAYGGYLTLLGRYHTMPVLAAGYGFSTSRGAVVLDQPPLSEAEQGRRLVEVSRTLESGGWAGGFVSTWQDEWDRRSWNTAFAAAPSEHYLWHDLQTADQSFGLMAFAPGEEAVCVPDGDPSEWTAEDLLLERDGLRLSARYDAEGLYLLLEGVSREEPVYLPLDVSPEAGSRVCASPGLTFQREADFLLCLDGTDGSRLLVQERYDPLRERFLYETQGDDPFLDFPEAGGAFVPLGMAVQNPLLVDTLTPETRTLQRLGVWETGRLVHGNGDSRSADFNSLADFCFGEGCVEIRLPWLLLNVGSPASMQVHRDYYQHYGVEFRPVRELWVGAARGGGEIPMEALPVRGWKSLTYRERLKDSYFMLQAYWKGGGEYAAAG
ncbi:hypothetical protein AALC17_02480 [Oscillospiraceae bacterium 38-13]